MDQEHLVPDNCSTYSTNSSDMNVTCLAGNISESGDISGSLATLEQHQFARQVLFFYVLPCIAAVGVVGNSLSVSVLWENRGSHAFNAYLTALTLADILLLLLALSRCVILMAARYPDLRYPLINIYGEFYLGIVLGSWLQRISSSLISIISLERFVAVTFPFKVKSLALENHPAKIILLVVVCNMLCQVPTVVLLDITETKIPGTNTTMYGLGMRYASPVAGVVRQVYLVFLAVINMFIPLLIVSVSTVAILINLKMRHSSIRLSRTSVEEARERNTMTLTLVSMAIIFMLCYIPAIVIYALSANTEFRRREVYLVGIIVDVNIVCVCFNSATDFLIYFLRSKQFRMLFVTRFLPCCTIPVSPHKPSLTHPVAFSDKNAFTTETSRSPETSVVMESDIVEM